MHAGRAMPLPGSPPVVASKVHRARTHTFPLPRKSGQNQGVGSLMSWPPTNSTLLTAHSWGAKRLTRQRCHAHSRSFVEPSCVPWRCSCPPPAKCPVSTLLHLCSPLWAGRAQRPAWWGAQDAFLAAWTGKVLWETHHNDARDSVWLPGMRLTSELCRAGPLELSVPTCGQHLSPR